MREIKFPRKSFIFSVCSRSILFLSSVKYGCICFHLKDEVTQKQLSEMNNLRRNRNLCLGISDQNELCSHRLIKILPVLNVFFGGQLAYRNGETVFDVFLRLVK